MLSIDVHNLVIVPISWTSYEFGGNETPLVTQNRHTTHLQNAVAFLDAFLQTRV